MLSGTLHSQGHAWNAARGTEERLGQLLLLHGKEQEPTAELKAGEIGAVAKLAVTATGDTLSSKERPFTLPPLTFPEPTLIMAIEPQTKTDLDKMGPALQRMLEEEPSARVERSDAGEQILRTLGDAQAAVIIERLKRKFGAAIVTHTPRVPYRESIRGKANAHGRYKKQTGGHGMFGDVWIEIEPNPGGGVEFAEKVVGGSVPRNFFPGVEKGIRETAAEGVFAGYPLSDFKATLYDGSFHTVDSNELSFKIAASMALKDGILAAKPVLLEPIMTVAIRVPEAYMGEVNRDLNGRRGRVLGMDTAGRHAGHQRPRPAVGAVHLRHGAEVDHRRPRDVHLDPRSLRRDARAPRRQGRRGAPQGPRGRHLRSLSPRRPARGCARPPKGVPVPKTTPVTFASPTKPAGWTWEATNQEVAARYGLPIEQVVRFDQNTAPSPPGGSSRAARGRAGSRSPCRSTRRPTTAG